MDPADALQTILSLMQAGMLGVGSGGGGEAGPATENSPSPSPSSGPVTLPRMLMSMLSVSAAWDWLKVLLVGLVFETCRRYFYLAWDKVIDCFWVTATFDFHDDAGDWLLHWLSKNKVFHTARSVDVSGSFFGLYASTFDDLGEVGTDDDHVCFLPSYDRTYSLWYKGCYATVTREQTSTGIWSNKQVLTISILTWNTNIIRELLIEARTMYRAASEHVIHVYVEESTQWQRVASQDKRPLSSVVLDQGVLELVLADAKDFLDSKKWYGERGIPYRRGYLLYGVPGAGKTSMIHAIAGELGLHIYILSLSGLTDNSLKMLTANLPKKCIVLMEDIDAAFTHSMKRNISDPEKEAQREVEDAAYAEGQENNKDQQQRKSNTGGVTLSGLFNALDGIAAQEGRILFATTNDYSALDPALLRPGRLDLHIEFGLASKYQTSEIFKRFYVASDNSESAPSKEAPESEKKAKVEVSSRSEKSVVAADPFDRSAGADSTPCSEVSPLIPKGVSSAYNSLIRHRHGLSAQEAETMGERFAAAVPEYTFSMATLQGYLMLYKMQPDKALADAPEWVEKKLQEKEKAKKEKEKEKSENTENKEDTENTEKEQGLEPQKAAGSVKEEEEAHTIEKEKETAFA